MAAFVRDFPLFALYFLYFQSGKVGLFWAGTFENEAKSSFGFYS
ncbi:hypothetical protein HSISS2_2190 [Streptococcus sp. HSISS2]|nr:hypothetical protein HSISS2_2190 [Streptococcus sp. HSISS2]